MEWISHLDGLSEAAAITLLCSSLGGVEEQTYAFGGGYNRIDCVTETHAIEFGLDKATSRDSPVQAFIAAHSLANTLDLKPMVYIIGKAAVPGKHARELMLFGQQYDIETKYHWQPRLME